MTPGEPTGREWRRRPSASRRWRAHRGRRMAERPSTRTRWSPSGSSGVTLEHLHAAAERAGALQALDEGEQRGQGSGYSVNPHDLGTFVRDARQPAVVGQGPANLAENAHRRALGSPECLECLHALLQVVGRPTRWPLACARMGRRRDISCLARVSSSVRWTVSARMAHAHSPTPHACEHQQKAAGQTAGRPSGIGSVRAPRSGIARSRLTPVTIPPPGAAPNPRPRPSSWDWRRNHRRGAEVGFRAHGTDRAPQWGC